MAANQPSTALILQRPIRPPATRANRATSWGTQKPTAGRHIQSWYQKRCSRSVSKQYQPQRANGERRPIASAPTTNSRGWRLPTNALSPPRSNGGRLERHNQRRRQGKQRSSKAVDESPSLVLPLLPRQPRHPIIRTLLCRLTSCLIPTCKPLATTNIVVRCT